MMNRPLGSAQTQGDSVRRIYLRRYRSDKLQIYRSLKMRFYNNGFYLLPLVLADPGIL